MTWALIELALHPDKQDRLRKEILDLGGDPTYEQLMNELPYLDSVLREILRLHPPVETVDRKVCLSCEPTYNFVFQEAHGISGGMRRYDASY